MTLQDAAGQPLIAVEAALGRMVYRAATFELMVEMTGAYLAGSQAEAAAMAGKMITQSSDLCRRYAAAAPYLDDELRAQLFGILDGVKPHLADRNAYVHGAWAQPDGELIAMNSKSWGFRVKPMTVEALDSLARELTSFTDKLMDWLAGVLQLRASGRGPAELN